ncbi:MAG: hypothetical protein GY811_03085, partial [Myxococcales bacterium]|nr:hypothetical protein [Myxococcales bacterium]
MRRWLLSLVILTSACGSADNQDAQDAGVPADAAPSERDASGREDAGAAAPDAALPIGPCEWGDEETLASGFGDNTNAQVAIDSQGNAIAVWQGTSLDEFDIQTRRYDVGTDTWGAEETLASGFGDNTNAQVAIDEQGNAIA